MSDTAAAAAVAVVDPPPATREALATPAVRRQWVPILLATVIFSALSLTAAVKSAGFLEADSCTHFQYAKFALAEPHYLVNVWGRPFVTALYAIPAVLAGRMGVRVTSLVCALLTATMHAFLGGDSSLVWPAAGASVVCFALNAGLLRYLYYIERRRR